MREAADGRVSSTDSGTRANEASKRPRLAERIVIVPAEAQIKQTANGNATANAREHLRVGASFDYWRSGVGAQAAHPSLRVFGRIGPVPLLLAIVECLILSIVLSAVLGVGFAEAAPGGAPVKFALALSMSAMAAMISVGLYRVEAFLHFHVALVRLVTALVLAVPIALALCVMFPTLAAVHGLAPDWPVKATVAWFICIAITRTIFPHISYLTPLKRRIVVVGTGAQAVDVENVAKNAKHGLTPVAFVRACGDPHLVRSIEVNADASRDDCALENISRELGAHEIVIATDDRRGLPVQQLLQCKLSGINVVDYPSFCERETGRVNLEALQPSWFIFSDGFRFGPVSAFVKRCFDVIASVGMLAVVLPVLGLTMLAISLEEAGPILYRQERVGLRGRRFVLLKFRSMRIDAERDNRPQWAQHKDPRVTRVGAFIRKFRIDELPQLINVIGGDMSLVGPRPERPYFVERLARQIPFYDARHAVRPGITGWAQVNYPYGASVEEAREKLSYDLYYVKNRSLVLDLVILAQTVRVIIWPEGAR